MKEFDREKVFAAVDESNKRFDSYTDEERKSFRETPVIKAPQWLIDRMEANRKRVAAMSPDEFLKMATIQMEASAKWRKENAHCPRHKDYDMVNVPNSNCYHCWSAYVDRHQTKEAVHLFWKAMEDYDGLQS